jgi:hypothetical protein
MPGMRLPDPEDALPSECSMSFYQVTRLPEAAGRGAEVCDRPVYHIQFFLPPATAVPVHACAVHTAVRCRG